MTRIGSLFSGAGGLDLAVEAVFGGRTVWHSELDPAASKVLAHRWPNVPNLGDITTVDWDTVEPVDVLCGGFPCQDLSCAGKRAGLADGTRSGLWAEYARAVDILRPRWVVIENVRGILSVAANRTVESDEAIVGDGSGGPVLRALGAVLGDLADLGYDAQWTTIAASSVGAPHRRERVFILATAADAEYGAGHGEWPCDEGQSEPARLFGGSDAAQRSAEPVNLLPTPAACNPNDGETPETWLVRRDAVKERVKNGNGMGMPLSIAVQLLPTPRAARGASGTETMYALGGERSDEHRTQGEVLLPTPTTQDGKNNAGPSQHHRNTPPLNVVATLLPTPNASDGTGGGQHPDKRAGHSQQLIDYVLAPERWGKYAPAIERWESIVGPAPSPTEPNRNGNPRLSAAFAEWMMGWPAGWVTDPAIGITRNDQLRVIGNGVVPQQAVAALRWLLRVAEVAA